MKNRIIYRAGEGYFVPIRIVSFLKNAADTCLEIGPYSSIDEIFKTGPYSP